MATQFRCENERRRNAVRFPDDGAGNPIAPAINGIDYLEVAASQRTLLVHFIHPLPGQPNEVPSGQPALTAGNVVIDGGVRVTAIRVEDATAAGEVLTVEVDRPGDFSTYQLRLVNSVTDGSVPGGFRRPARLPSPSRSRSTARATSTAATSAPVRARSWSRPRPITWPRTTPASDG